MNNKRFQDIFFDAMVVDGDKGWVFANNVNALFSVDLNSYESIYLGSVPSESILSKSLYHCILKVGSKLVMLPAHASFITIYDLYTSQFETIDKLSSEDSFFAGCIYKNKVYMIGDTVAKICVLNLETKQLYYIATSILQGGDNQKKDRIFCRKGAARVNDTCYFALCRRNGIAKLDLERESVCFVEIDGVRDGLRSLCYEGNNVFWLNEFNTPVILRWSEEQGVLDKYEYDAPDYNDYRVGDMYYTDRVWLFPTLGKDILTFIPSQNKWEIPKEISMHRLDAKEHEHLCGRRSFPKTVLENESFYIFDSNYCEILKYSYIEGIIKSFRVKVDMRRIFSDYYVHDLKQGVIYENNEFELDDFLILI